MERVQALAIMLGEDSDMHGLLPGLRKLEALVFNSKQAGSIFDRLEALEIALK